MIPRRLVKQARLGSALLSRPVGRAGFLRSIHYQFTAVKLGGKKTSNCCRLLSNGLTLGKVHMTCSRHSRYRSHAACISNLGCMKLRAPQEVNTVCTEYSTLFLGLRLTR